MNYQAPEEIIIQVSMVSATDVLVDFGANINFVILKVKEYEEYISIKNQEGLKL